MVLDEKDPAEIADLYDQHADLIGEQLSDLRREITALLAAGDEAGADRKRVIATDLQAQRRQHRFAAKRYRQQCPTIVSRNSVTHAVAMKGW